jgi:hypothetical protein
VAALTGVIGSPTAVYSSLLSIFPVTPFPPPKCLPRVPVAARARFVRTFFALSPILVDVVLDDGGEEKEKEEDDEVEGRGDDGEEAGEEERGIVDEEDCFRC